MIDYKDIILRDNLKEIKSGISEVSAASVDIIPYGQNVLTWEDANKKYDQVLVKPNTSVVSERTCNCYVRGKNLGSKSTTGTVELFLMPFNVFCNPERWIRLNAYSPDGNNYITQVPMITKQGTAVSETIGAGAVCINRSAFLLSDDYHLKQGEHYCLCAVVNTPDHPVVIPKKFEDNISVDRWVTENRNVALLNVHPVSMNVKQTDYSYEFGNNDDKPCDFRMNLIFSCSYKKGEVWSTKSTVRIQCTDSAYPFDFKGLHIQTHQEGALFQEVSVELKRIPAKYSGVLNVYIDNIDPAPNHPVVLPIYDQILDKIPEGYEDRKDRLLPYYSDTNKVRYLLRLGECSVYGDEMSIHQFYQQRDELLENLREERERIWAEYNNE